MGTPIDAVRFDGLEQNKTYSVGASNEFSGIAVGDNADLASALFLGFVVWNSLHDDYLSGAMRGDDGIVSGWVGSPQYARHFSELKRANGEVTRRGNQALKVLACFDAGTHVVALHEW